MFSMQLDELEIRKVQQTLNNNSLHVCTNAITDQKHTLYCGVNIYQYY